MSSAKSQRYWTRLGGVPGADRGAPHDAGTGLGEGLARREFLRAAGFVFGGAALTRCSKAPVEKAIPYLIKPEEITPGRAVYYASTCGACTAACGLLVKCRDGRPIKLEGNPDHPLSRGGLCAVGQASILGLYDSRRLQHPLRGGREASWEEVDRAIVEHLETVRKQRGAIRLLTGTIHSPSARTAIADFLAGFSDARHVTYDSLSCSAILEAHRRTHGARLLPHYRFEQAKLIVSFDADFLGTWISPVEFARGYQAGRDLPARLPEPSYHVQFEGRLSLTGTKADRRIRIAPHELGPALEHLAARVARRAGVGFDAGGITEPPVSEELLEEIAGRLWAARGESLVLCGAQDPAAQTVCNFLNEALGNYGATIDLQRPSFQLQGDDGRLEDLLQELERGRVTALLIAGVNPVYELPGGDRIAARLRNTPLVVSFAERLDETASEAQFVCPDHHYLESWGDREPVSGVVSLLQPCIRPLGSTRQLIESLAVWRGEPKPAYEIVRDYWRRHLFPLAGTSSFEAFWDQALSAGCFHWDASRPAPRFEVRGVIPVGSAAPPAEDEYTLVLYPKVGMRDGAHAYNAWLQELPDPVTKVAWDNYACLSPATARRMGLGQEDVVRVEAGEQAIELPVVVQPGQHDRVVAIALGYGSKLTERFAGLGPRWLEGASTAGSDGRVGKNAASLLALAGGALQYAGRAVKLRRAGRRLPLAGTQGHHHIEVPERLAPPGGEVRPVIQEVALSGYQEAVAAGREYEQPHHPDLWPEDHPFTGRRWAMTIDLNACTGCSACVIACQVENNISVVGKDEVRRSREMHWLRIDSYYAGDGDELAVAHQPMMCQQCDHAPCETVCPVLATVHSEEGLNQQIYNRCVGTRYCANNCPYKVRRFNWFDYPRKDRLENMVLNPDVTVRSRGVMEKCTFCVQRIQEAKIEAKRLGKPLQDGAIQPACQQTCPAGAIVFGDLNDPESRISRLFRDPRRYHVLEELNVRPSVGYLKLVRRQPAVTESRVHG